MYKVKCVFKDKYTEHLYSVGEDFTSDEPERINDLLNRGLIEGVSEDPPSPPKPKKAATGSRKR
jgi:hypothetical protein